MALAAKDVFDDRYVIEGLLGEGGMGAVFAAYDTRLRRRVALKVLPTDSREDAEAAERLVREARAVATLDHPNVVAVFDVGRVESTPFIAMELVEGRPLRALIGCSEVTLAAKIRWITDVARALSAAHDKHLVHRDIKPSNVLVRDDGVVKVVDFGVARRVKQEDASDDSATITKEGAIVGTHQYMAPEVLRGEPADERSDQFAWAVLAYELVTGALPWRIGKTTPDVIAAILLQPAAPLDDVAELPSEVEAAILRALSKTPAKRFASMRDVVLALEPHVSSRTSALPKELVTSSRRVRGDETLTKHTVSLPNVAPSRRRAWALAPLLIAGIAVALALREPAPLLATRAIGEPQVVTVTDLPVPTVG
ncbi:MAG TPA: serine/threonine-protein kinase, partial [Polyangiaceae bacterium]|nr:serine/threonine-protein kinase [Polyangiaceae bacterium]